jgi:hypothetical protein
MSTERGRWQRIVGEAALIIASVFVAIVLEGLWQERVQAAEARAALGQLLNELREDRVEAERVISRQVEIDGEFLELRTWLAAPSTLPADAFNKNMDSISLDNSGLYARKSAWFNMVASGHLPLLNDSSLVSKLADLYEKRMARLNMNNENYDNINIALMRESGTAIWDGDNRRLLTDDPLAISTFRGELRYVHIAWNKWYIDFVKGYAGALDELIAEVDAYLQEHGD